MLINNYHIRQLRSEAKQYTLLKFLRDETWSDAVVLAKLLNLSRSGIYKTLKSLESKGFIHSYLFPELNKRVWGITTLGLLESWSDSEQMEDRAYFYPGRIKPLMVQHHIDTQHARLNAVSADWTNWRPGSLLPKIITKRPDAVAINTEQQKIAIEIERTIKTKKRYEVILSTYLQEIKKNTYDQVHYVCPDPVFATRLNRMFSLIKTVPVAGERIKLNDKHMSRFNVFSLANWP